MQEVPVKCPCGVRFMRPVRRGRPQVWCEPCRQLPFYERAVVSVSPDEASPEAVEPGKTMEQVRRERIEAAVADLNRKWHDEIVPNIDTLFTGTELSHDGFWSGEMLAARAWFNAEMAAIYASNPSRRSPKGEEIEDDE